MITATFRDMPAFPVDSSKPGMTLRHYFAAMALQGLLAHGGSQGKGYAPEIAAEDAVKFADALIAALGHQPSQ